MFQAIGKVFQALFATASVVERVAVSADNLAKVGQAHTTSMLNETLKDLGISEEDLSLDSETKPK